MRIDRKRNNKRRVNKNLVIIISIFILSLMLITGHATIAFWSGAELDWEESIYSPGIKGKTIILDPGHGGRDPGVVVGEIKEKDITLAIAKELKPLLEKEGAKVILTHDGEEGLITNNIVTRAENIELLMQRRNMVFSEKGSVLITIHVNSFRDSGVRGPIVFFKQNHFLNEILADKMQQELNLLFGINKNKKEGNFTMLSQETVPTVLIEAGFLTNSQDRKFINSKKGQEQVAQAIFKALEGYGEYLSQLYEENNLPKESSE